MVLGSIVSPVISQLEKILQWRACLFPRHNRSRRFGFLILVFALGSGKVCCFWLIRR